jgi:hypothetical protein
MSEEGFLRRWARRKTEVREGRAAEPAPTPAAAPGQEPLRVPEPAAAVLVEAGADSSPQAHAPAPAQVRTPAAAPALPTMDDVASLGADSDFSAFVARGVDQAVRRSALKKLFADPHFNVMDKLDVYIDDYTKPSPVSEAMLASLSHAKSVFMRAVQDEEGAPGEAPPALAQAEQEAPAAQLQQSIKQPPEHETP